MELKSGKVFVTILLCASSVLGAPILYTSQRSDTDGQPGCKTRGEFGRLWRNNQDPSTYWECTAWAMPAIERNCAPYTRFQDSWQTCVPYTIWEWTPPMSPPSSPYDEISPCEPLDITESPCECPTTTPDIQTPPENPTTQEPDTTTDEPEISTTEEPETTTDEMTIPTTEEPDTTTDEPEISTTEEPETTTDEMTIPTSDGTTTEEPDTTTDEPEISTTEEPDTTTDEITIPTSDGTTTEEPDTTTDEPEISTTEEPDTTTDDPDEETTTLCPPCPCLTTTEDPNSPPCDCTTLEPLPEIGLPCTIPKCETQAELEVLWPSRDPSIFYQCQAKYMPMTMPCAPGTCFHFKLQVCVHPWDFVSFCAAESSGGIDLTKK